MFRNTLVRAALVAGMLSWAGTAQQKNEAPQSARQALIEMFSGGDEAFKKHLTIEVQAKVNESLKDAAPPGSNPLQALTTAKAMGGDNFESFVAGPILFSLNNPQRHERLEVRVDADEIRGDEDEMQLSLHEVRNGADQETPIGLRLQLGWKQQQGTWRLNTLTVSVNLPVGDPKILDKSTWIPPVISSLGNANPTPAPTPAPADTPPKISPARSVRLIGMAEGFYAKKHPDIGFTCFLKELVNIGRGSDNGEVYRFIDPEFADGVYNGYKFTLSGCSGKPVKAFKVTAEPLNGSGRAYCSDSSLELRASEDGRGSSCLATGKPVRQ
jgi:hypothetical protein